MSRDPAAVASIPLAVSDAGGGSGAAPSPPPHDDAPSSSSPSSSPGPRPGPSPGPALARLEVIDALRGFALCGVLVVNMLWFSSNRDLAMMAEFTVADAAAFALVTLLAEWKFITIFSFLFGLGFALQMQRAGGDPAFPRRFRRGRLRWLFYFGLVHGALVWMGDILLAYSIAGLVMVAWFRARADRTLLRWAVVLVAVLPVVAGGLVALGQAAEAEQAAVRGTSPRPLAVEERTWSEEAFWRDLLDERHWRDQLAEWYRDGTWCEVATARLIEWTVVTLLMLFVLPTIVGVFLVGLVAGRRGLFADLDAHAATWRRIARWGLVVGLPLNAAYLLLTTILAGRGADDPIPAFTFLVTLCAFVGAPALAAAYVGGFALAWRDDRWRRWLAPLAPVGRMALTNYLVQSLACTTIFYGFGFGLYNQLGTATTTAIALVIFAAQLAFSHYWMRRWRFGPMEWAWRRLAYGTPPPMRGGALGAPASASAAAAR